MYTKFGINVKLILIKSLKKQEFLVTNTILKTEIPRIVRQLGYKHNFCQKLVSTQRNCSTSCIHKKVTCLNVFLLKFLSGCVCLFKTVYWWVTTNCVVSVTYGNSFGFCFFSCSLISSSVHGHEMYILQFI